MSVLRPLLALSLLTGFLLLMACPPTGPISSTGSGGGNDDGGNTPPDTETICDNGIDEDFDGLVDCADDDCSGSAVCGGPGGEGDCGNGVDDDGDTLIDCDDGDCLASPLCGGAGTETNCTNGFDDDVDGWIDCLDPDCADDAACAPEQNCGDGQDNDNDGLIDCDDPDCEGRPACVESNCNDGQDNDGDGVSDCNDPDCNNAPNCNPEANCGDGQDNDLDGFIDCNDSDCIGSASCPELNCNDGFDNDQDGFIDCNDSDCNSAANCQPESNCTDGLDNDSDGFSDCNDSDCIANPACAPQTETACADGVDNDSDGSIDCLDSDCAGDPVCQGGGCTPGSCCYTDTLVISPIPGQYVGSLSSNDTLGSPRGGSYYMDDVEFSGTAGTQYLIYTSGSAIDAYLYVLDEGCNVLTQDNDSGTGTEASIVFTAPYTGVFTVVVTTDVSNQTGAFTLNIDEGVGSCAIGTCCYASTATTTIGNSINASLTSADQSNGPRGAGFYFDDFEFQGTAGQSVTMYVVSNPTGADSYMYLLDDSCATIAQDDDSNGNLDPRITGFSLPYTGVYTVVVTSYGAGTTFDYTLTLQ